MRQKTVSIILDAFYGRVFFFTSCEHSLILINSWTVKWVVALWAMGNTPLTVCNKSGGVNLSEDAASSYCWRISQVLYMTLWNVSMWKMTLGKSTLRTPLIFVVLLLLLEIWNHLSQGPFMSADLCFECVKFPKRWVGFDPSLKAFILEIRGGPRSYFTNIFLSPLLDINICGFRYAACLSRSQWPH